VCDIARTRAVENQSEHFSLTARKAVFARASDQNPRTPVGFHDEREKIASIGTHEPRKA
jgi:hypothetical protein